MQKIDKCQIMPPGQVINHRHSLFGVSKGRRTLLRIYMCTFKETKELLFDPGGVFLDVLPDLDRTLFIPARRISNEGRCTPKLIKTFRMRMRNNVSEFVLTKAMAW